MLLLRLGYKKTAGSSLDTPSCCLLDDSPGVASGSGMKQPRVDAHPADLADF